MKKTILTLAAVMAFGSIGLQAQQQARLDKVNKIAQQQRQTRYDLIAPVEANFTADGNTYRETFTYDEYEYTLLEDLTQVLAGGTWQNAELTTYEYNWIGSVDTRLKQEWANGAWVNDEKETNTYDANNMPDETVIQKWQNGAWANELKMSYNITMDQIAVLFYDWNGTNWIVDELYTLSMDMTGYTVLIQYMQGGAWQNDKQLTFRLNADFNVDLILEQAWEDNSWVNEKKVTYTYDGDLYTTITHEEWTTDWTPKGEATYTYDSNGNATRGLYKAYVNGQLVPADGPVSMAYDYNSDVIDFEAQEVSMTYADITAVSENAASRRFSAYPNPAKGFLNVDGEGFANATLYNMAGQAVRTSDIPTISLEGLEAGIYMIKIESAQGTETHKVTVR